jgi:hypothetical protein
MPGPLALVGSGEYLPVLERVERLLLEGRPARFVQLATAAAPEGPASLARWHELGRASAERLGVQQVVVPVVDRISADDEELAGLVAGAGLVYLSGGSPTFLAATLRGTAVWRAIEAAWGGGAALAGCSAGAMAMSSHVPDLRHPLRAAEPGTRASCGTCGCCRTSTASRARVPDVLLTRLVETPPGVTVARHRRGHRAGRGPYEWEVMGRQSVWVLGADGPHGAPDGEPVVHSAAGGR